MNKKQTFTFHKRVKSFLNAKEGLKHVFMTQHNFWIHIVAAIAVISLGFILRVSITEWCFLIFAVGFVLVAEVFNTAIESLTDLVSPDFHELAKISKDVSAGAVLVAAFISLLVGIIIFIPKI